MASCSEDNAGSEILLLALEALQTTAGVIAAEQVPPLLHGFQRNLNAHHMHKCTDSGMCLSEAQAVRSSPEPTAAASSRPQLARKLIWFHHIKSTAKRKDIVSWAHELSVRGFSKPGFPGIIICEGMEDDVQVSDLLSVGCVLAAAWRGCVLCCNPQETCGAGVLRPHQGAAVAGHERAGGGDR